MSTRSQTITYTSTYNGLPATGLTVTYKLYASNSEGYELLITDETLTEIGNGIYYDRKNLQSNRDYVAVFNPGTDNVDGFRTRYEFMNNNTLLVEDFKKTVTSQLGTLSFGGITNDEIEKIAERIKKDIKEPLGEEIINKVAQSIVKQIKTSQSENKTRFTNLLEVNRQIEEKLSDFYFIFEKIEELPEKFKSNLPLEELLKEKEIDFGPLKNEILENLKLFPKGEYFEEKFENIKIPEKRIEMIVEDPKNKEEIKNTKKEYKKILEYLEKSKAKTETKLKDVTNFLKNNI